MRTVDELLERARALRGRTVASIADELRLSTDGDAVRTKGRPGEILERALGATGGPTKIVDFPDLGIELKTVPVDENGRPIETTYVCKISLSDADTQEWETSWVRAKLTRVLFVPLYAPEGRPWPERIVGEAVLWSPSPEEEAVLRADFDDAMGLIGVGRIEELTAHLGQWLQVRPKARDGTKSGVAFGPENEAIAAVPRGFYLRTTLTETILRGRRP